jgi:hypothetical protein
MKFFGDIQSPGARGEIDSPGLLGGNNNLGWWGDIDTAGVLGEIPTPGFGIIYTPGFGEFEFAGFGDIPSTCVDCGNPLTQQQFEGLISWGCSWCLPVARASLAKANRPDTPPVTQLLLGTLAGAALTFGILMTAQKILETFSQFREELA